MRAQIKIVAGLLSLFAAATFAVGQEQSAVEQDAGLLMLVVRGTNGLAPITKQQWEDVNKARLAHKWQTYSYDEARTNSSINTPYVIMAFVMLETEITAAFQKANSRPPFSQEVLACWLIGKDKFKKLRWDASKITDERVSRKIDKFVSEKRFSNLIKARPPDPPPLPTNETRRDLIERQSGPRQPLPGVP